MNPQFTSIIGVREASVKRLLNGAKFKGGGAFYNPLPFLTTKNRKLKNSMITNSRLNNYQPIGKSINMMYDNKLELNKSKEYKDVANKRLNELNKMASINPYPINYENKVSAMTKDYFNYDTQTEQELNKYYKKNKNK